MKRPGSLLSPSGDATQWRAAMPACLSPLLLAALLVSACGHENAYAPPPAPEVSVSQPIEREVTTYSEFTGTTAAVETLDIRARVQGYLKSVNFTPGGFVTKGQLLFVIEPDLYATQVAQAEADLAGKEAQGRSSVEQLSMTQAMFARSAGSRTDLIQKQQQSDQAKSAVEIAKANLNQAKLNLSYTSLYAPFDGRIDRNQVDVGNLVGVGQPTILATMVRADPIYVYFTASEREVMQYRELQSLRRTAASDGEQSIAYMGLATEDGFPHVGKVDYSSNRVDSSTGTIEIRAVFPNTDAVLIPGLFARIRLPFTRGKEVLVPDVALGADQGGRYLLVVDDKNVVQLRRVETGVAAGDGLRIVRSGITTSDTIVVNGLQRAHPGGVVKPLRVEVGAPTPAGSVGSAATPDAPRPTPSAAGKP